MQEFWKFYFWVNIGILLFVMLGVIVSIFSTPDYMLYLATAIGVMSIVGIGSEAFSKPISSKLFWVTGLAVLVSFTAYDIVIYLSDEVSRSSFDLMMYLIFSIISLPTFYLFYKKSF